MSLPFYYRHGPSPRSAVDFRIADQGRPAGHELAVVFEAGPGLAQDTKLVEGYKSEKTQIVTGAGGLHCLTCQIGILRLAS